LEVKTNSSKLWRYRFRIDGKENLFAIGAYPDVSLSDARAAMSKAKAQVKEGINPNHTRHAERLVTRTARGNTFESIAIEWIAKNKPSWSVTYHRQVEKMLSANVYPEIGKLPIRSVNSAHLLSIIRTVEGRGASNVALLIRQWSSAIFRYATLTLRADFDPAAALRGAIHLPKTKHHKPLNRTQATELMMKLTAYTGMPETVIAIKLLAITFLRTGELRKAKWADIDFEAARWNVPADMMKKRRPHIVPLSTQALAMLQQLQQLTGHREHLFPNRRRPTDCITSTTINRVLERLGFSGKGTRGFSGHGFRATASTMLNELGYRTDVIEKQLAHEESDRVRASYNQADYLSERVEMMQQWSDIFDGFSNGSNVVPFRSIAA
jgi:integrase